METIALHVLDIVQNSIDAHASIINIKITYNESSLLFCIEDNGKGMSEEKLKKIADPFYTTKITRKVGLGIPLLKQNVEQSGGRLFIHSVKDAGTKIEFMFLLSNIDCPPIGNLADVLSFLIVYNNHIEFNLIFSNPNGYFNFNSNLLPKISDHSLIEKNEMKKALEEYFDYNINAQLNFTNQYDKDKNIR